MADEEHARAGKEWLTSWKMGWRVCGRCRRERMLLQQYSNVGPRLEVLQPTTTRDLGETRDGGGRGWEGAQVWR